MGWLPGAIIDPGRHANYEAGVTSCAMDVWHFTVGSNSIALIRDNGLCAFLIRDEGIYEFGPSDAVHFTQCEWNRVATAVEIESLDGSISPQQIAHLQYLTLWKMTEHGIPEAFYDGPRMPIGTPYRGVTNHRNLVHQACDQHSDGFDQWVFDAVVAGAPKQPGDTMASFIIAETRPGRTDPTKGTITGSVHLFDMDANTRSWIRNPAALDAAVSVRNIVKFVGGWADSTIHGSQDNDGVWGKLLDDARDLDAQDDVAAGGAAPGGGATPEQVAAIVQTDGQITRTAIAQKRPITGTVG